MENGAGKRLSLLHDKYPQFAEDFSLDGEYVDLIYDYEGISFLVYFYYHVDGCHETSTWIMFSSGLVCEEKIRYALDSLENRTIGPLRYEQGELHGTDADWIIAMADYGIRPAYRGVNLIELAQDIISVNTSDPIRLAC